VAGLGDAEIVPTGWGSPARADVLVRGGREVAPAMGGRAYFAEACTAGTYNHSQYLALDLRGKTLRYTTDVSSLGCGCNAALYLTSMRQNPHASECSDFYCDANNVCGQSCAEIDIQEGNRFAWHSTLHTQADHSGLGMGLGGGGWGWSGPRDWASWQYGPGAACVDTTKPFEVAVSFPLSESGELAAMQVVLSQEGHSCPPSVSIGGYGGMPELSAALEAGMTPIVSYWSSDDMLWMDGKGSDNQGPCAVDQPQACGDEARFWNFSIECIDGSGGRGCKLERLKAQPQPSETDEPRGAHSGTDSWWSSTLQALEAAGVKILLFAGVTSVGISAIAGSVCLVLSRRRRRTASALSVEPAQAAPPAGTQASLERTRPSTDRLLALAPAEAV